MLTQEETYFITKILNLIDNKNQNLNINNNISFATLLENYVHFDFTEDDAKKHWENILKRHEEMEKKLNESINIHVAIADYFTNPSRKILDNPMLIEIHVFKETEQAAMIDGLTGLFNRRYMDIVLKKEFNRCTRYKKRMSICILDIDNFKMINDIYGHQFGDKVLQNLAKELKVVLREEDIACRYGGEEFLLILPETNGQGAKILSERIRTNLAKIDLFKEKNITFSCGVATIPSSAYDVQSLIHSADKALYEAKFSGKNMTIIAPEERRRYDRFPQTWNINIYQEDPSNFIKNIVTKDVSFGGIQFEASTIFTVDTILYFHFTSPEHKNKIIEVKGRITWAKSIKENSYAYGVSFINMPNSLREAFGFIKN